MLSLNDEINEFIKSLGNKDLYDAVWFVHQELTKVDRMLMKRSLTLGNRKKQMEKHASDLRDLISSMRYAAIPRKVNGAEWFELLNKRF